MTRSDARRSPPAHQRPSSIGAIDASTAVLVIGAQSHGPLGIFRSLGRLGIPVHAIDPDPRLPPSYSRYLRSRSRIDLTDASSDALIEQLLHVADAFDRQPIVIPTSDQTAMLVDEHRDALRSNVVIPPQPRGLASSLADKRTMAHLAVAHGVPTPRVEFPKDVDEVRRYAADGVFPVMLKGIDGARLKARTGRRMVIVEERSQLEQIYREMEDPAAPNLMLQEYIPGGDNDVWMFNGYFDANSDCLVGFTGRKIRQSPIHTGATSLGVCLPNPEVEETTMRWMKELGYRGILDIGYRFDARDGRYKVLDVNPRIGATFRLFVARNGMDVVRAQYLDLTDQPVPTAALWNGRRWINEGADFKSSALYAREGTLKPRSWLASLRGIREGAYFARDDLEPFVRMAGSLVRKPKFKHAVVPRSAGRAQRSVRQRSAADADRSTSVDSERDVKDVIESESEARVRSWVDEAGPRPGSEALEIGSGAGNLHR
jgi:D-aspartate ligase